MAHDSDKIDDSIETPAGEGLAGADEGSSGATDRRDFLKKTVRRAAYVAPIVLLFKPREALAGSGGSAITPGP
ncbi:MAG TPA: hypothetical protein P5081_21555 [Phycisphaerae bacterium]|nr:hypothetical protein [Phycisphaerae bacterium]HRW55468.1 hypothetical protein [Phycisphaerae bacterium]